MTKTQLHAILAKKTHSIIMNNSKIIEFNVTCPIYYPSIDAYSMISNRFFNSNDINSNSLS